MHSTTMVNQSAARNWWVDVFVFLGGLTAILSGIYFLFLPLSGYRGGQNPSYGITILFDRHTWEGLHTWTGVFFALTVLVHLILHWNWISGMTRRIVKELFSRQARLSKKGRWNAVVDFSIGAGFLASALSGILFLLEPTLARVFSTAWSFNAYLWDVIHTWSSVVMIIGILLHLAAHWSWIKTITRRIFMRKASVERIVPDHEGVQ